MPPGHFTKNRFDCIFRLVKLFTLLLFSWYAFFVYSRFIPDFSCLFQSGRLFHLYMSEVWVCNIHPSGCWLQFLVCLFFFLCCNSPCFWCCTLWESYLFHTISVCLLWDLKHLCTPRPLPGRFLGEKKFSVEVLFPFFDFFKRCGVRNVISCKLSCVLGWLRQNLSVPLWYISLWLHQNWVC